MEALWLQDGIAQMRELSVPEPTEGEALLQLRVAAISPADIAAPASFTGTPGTDGVATVLSSPIATQVGQRVVIRHPLACRVCRGCFSGNPDHCSAPLTVTSGGKGGTLAQTFVWPADHLVTLPPNVRDYDAVLANGLARGLAALVHASQVNRLLVIGDGPRPAVAALALRGHQRMVHLAVEDESRAERFKRFNVLRDPGGRFPLVLFTPAVDNDLAGALLRVEPGGTILLDGEAGTKLAGDIAPAISRGVSIQPLAPGSLTDALEKLAKKDVCESLSKVREESFPLASADLALAKARTPGTLQILVDNL
jgi:D-arabinose 1-dehydrogenase-like Zn-dependent alcohol dehydrogenase